MKRLCKSVHMLWASSVYPFETKLLMLVSNPITQPNPTCLFSHSFFTHHFNWKMANTCSFFLLAELLAVNALGFQLHTSFNKKCQADRDSLLQDLCRDRLKGFLVFFGYKQAQGFFFLNLVPLFSCPLFCLLGVMDSSCSGTGVSPRGRDGASNAKFDSVRCFY